MRDVKNPWVRGAFLALVTVIVLMAVFFDPLVRPIVKHDRLDALPQDGTATVDSVSLPPPGADVSQQALVYVRFRGRLCKARIVERPDALKPNTSAAIIYRQGKSGRIYVESVRPLPGR